jgi:hypothetical protein
MTTRVLTCHDGCETDSGKTKRFMTYRTLVTHYAKTHFKLRNTESGQFKYAETLLFYVLGNKYNPDAEKYFCDTCLRNYNKCKEYRRDETDKLFLHYCENHFDDSQFVEIYDLLSNNWDCAVPTDGDISVGTSRGSSRASSRGSNAGTDFRFARDEADMEDWKVRYPYLKPDITEYLKYKNTLTNFGPDMTNRIYDQLEEEAKQKQLVKEQQEREHQRLQFEVNLARGIVGRTTYALAESSEALNVHANINSAQNEMLHQNTETMHTQANMLAASNIAPPVNPQQQQLIDMQRQQMEMMQKQMNDMMMMMTQMQVNNNNTNLPTVPVQNPPTANTQPPGRPKKEKHSSEEVDFGK